MSRQQNPTNEDHEAFLKEMFSNSVATMDHKGRLTHIDTNDFDAHMEAMMIPRWQITSVLANGNEISTVFLMYKSANCFFESALIDNNRGGHITVTHHYETYMEAKRSHKHIVRYLNHKQIFGTKENTDGVLEWVFHNKPNKLKCDTYLTKEARHRAIKMKRQMKKLIDKNHRAIKMKRQMKKLIDKTA